MHLKGCDKVDNLSFKLPPVKKATEDQIKYILNLIDDLGYDPEDYAFVDMSITEASTLIDELKNEL